jgi:hypothetical protein
MTSCRQTTARVNTLRSEDAGVGEHGRTLRLAKWQLKET